MLSIHPDDFNKNEDRKKIIVFLHTLEAKIRNLEKAVRRLSERDADLKKDIDDLLKTY